MKKENKQLTVTHLMNGMGTVISFDEKTGYVEVEFKTGRITLKIPESFIAGYIIFNDPMMQMRIEEIVDDYQTKLLELEETVAVDAENSNDETVSLPTDFEENNESIDNDNNFELHNNIRTSRWEFDIPADWPVDSKFSICGYSVAQNSGLTTYQRQGILSDMIKEGKTTPWEAIEYLQRNINLRHTRPNLRIACSRWRDDINYIRTHFD